MFIAIFIGIIIGGVLGLTGAGGSIFAVPLLMLLLGLSAPNAMGIALGAVAVSAAIGTIAQRKQVFWVPALTLSAGGMLTAPLGKMLAVNIDETMLVYGFAAIAIAIGIKMLRSAFNTPEQSSYVRGGTSLAGDSSPMLCRLSPTGQFQLRARCISGLAIGGAAIGFASGLFGVGGGFLIVPLLLFLSQTAMPRAVATSLAAITMISSVGFGSHYVISGINNPKQLLTVLLAAIVGMLLSQQMAKHVAGPNLQKLFALLLIMVALLMLIP